MLLNLFEQEQDSDEEELHLLMMDNPIPAGVMSSLIEENSFKRTPGKGVLFGIYGENDIDNRMISGFMDFYMKKMQIGTKKSYRYMNGDSRQKCTSTNGDLR